MDSVGHVLHMAAPPRLGDIGAPPNYIETNTEGCQRNMPQMKEQNKTPEKDLNKMETIY